MMHMIPAFNDRGVVDLLVDRANHNSPRLIVQLLNGPFNFDQRSCNASA